MENQIHDAGLKKDAIGLGSAMITGMAQVAPAFALFFSTSLMVSVSGVSVPLVFIVAMLGIAATANTLGQFSSEFPSAGSFVTFIARTLGPKVSVVVALSALLGYIITFGGMYIYVGSYIVQEVFGNPQIPFLTQFVTIVYGAIVTAPVILGVRSGVRVAIVLYLIEVAVLIVFIVGILAHGGAHGISVVPFTLGGGGIRVLALGLALGTVSFIGFEAPAPLAEETKNPRRNIYIALIGSVIISGLLFTLGSYAVISAFGDGNMAQLAKDPAPFVTASLRFVPFIAPIVVWLLLTSVTSSYIAANTQTARVIYNGAREGLWMRWLGKSHPKYQSPWTAAIGFVAPSIVIGVLSTIWTDPVTASGFLATFGGLLVIIMFVVTNLALIVHWFKSRNTHGNKHFLTRVIIPIIGIIVLGFPIWGTLEPGQTPPYNYIPWLLIAMLVGTVLYMLWLQSTRPKLLANAGRMIMGDMENPEATSNKPSTSK